MMKKFRFLGTLAIVASMLIACQEETLDSTQPKTFNHSSARENVDDCKCVDDYDDSKVTFTFGTPEITVEIWNDATTVHYYLHRTDFGQIGNLKVGPNEREISPMGGGRDDEYEFEEPVANLASCALQTIYVKVVGVGEQGDGLTANIPYKIVTLCPPTCTYETGMGGGTRGPITDKNKAWWYYYTAGSGVQTIWAGQTQPAGTVTIDGSGNFKIELADGWELKSGVTEPVKIKSYEILPTSRPAAGLFSGPSSYKGPELERTIEAPSNYYVIHLDLQKCASIGE